MSGPRARDDPDAHAAPVELLVHESRGDGAARAGLEGARAQVDAGPGGDLPGPLREQAVELLEGVEGEPDLDAAPVLRPGLDVNGRVRFSRLGSPGRLRPAPSTRFERDGGVEVSEDRDEPRDRSDDRDRPRGGCEPGREAVIAEQLGHACLALRVRDGLAP